MSTFKLTHPPKVARSAAIGAVVSLALAAVGHRLDAAVPAIPLDHQVLYNWAMLLLSPVSSLARLANPDGPIVPSLSFALVAAAFNALGYAFVSWSFAAVRNTLRLPVDASTSVSVPLQQSPAAGGFSSTSRRFSPSEQLADRFENRLSSEQSDSPEVEVPILSVDRR